MPVYNRSASGVRVMRIADDAKVAKMTFTAREDENDTQGGENEGEIAEGVAENTAEGITENLTEATDNAPENVTDSTDTAPSTSDENNE